MAKEELIKNLREYKALADEFYRDIVEKVDKAKKLESDIDLLFLTEEDEVFRTSQIAYNIFEYDSWDIERFLEYLDELIKMLEEERRGS